MSASDTVKLKSAMRSVVARKRGLMEVQLPPTDAIACQLVRAELIENESLPFGALFEAFETTGFPAVACFHIDPKN